MSLLFHWERRFPLASTHWQRTRPRSLAVPEGSYHMTSQLDDMCSSRKRKCLVRGGERPGGAGLGLRGVGEGGARHEAFTPTS
ncbi:hypothetical protein EYF80_004913 [Liparis tanakae]|uniref:Uncharacterized protein n=1 Tax=Liparis tanakae TaxID=230148 RepID=A0A4Z2J5E1_9TELE|nr:hypothetical protein EYF80_004913 [Liparis tanakae]